MTNLDYKSYFERNLPHYQIPGATFFITFRLAKSLPKTLLMRLHQDYEELINDLTKKSNIQDQTHRIDEEQRRYFAKWDAALDQSISGPTWLKDPNIAKIVKNTLHHFDGKRYTLDAYCIMPNHVHTVLKPIEDLKGQYHSVSSIMHSIKRFSSRESNKFLNRKGEFWQHENYDHIIRDEAELLRIIHYILNNPINAGLVDEWEKWPWTYCRFWM